MSSSGLERLNNTSRVTKLTSGEAGLSTKFHGGKGGEWGKGSGNDKYQNPIRDKQIQDKSKAVKLTRETVPHSPIGSF